MKLSPRLLLVRRVKIKKKIPIRQCISCRTQLLRDSFVRLTKTYNLQSGLEEIVFNPGKFQLGRSAYVCKSENCLTKAIKERKIQKMLKTSAKNLEKVILKLQEVKV